MNRIVLFPVVAGALLLNGVHHFLLSSIPMSVQYGAVISTIAVEIVVTAVVVNFFASSAVGAVPSAT